MSTFFSINEFRVMSMFTKLQSKETYRVKIRLATHKRELDYTSESAPSMIGNHLLLQKILSTIRHLLLVVHTHPNSRCFIHHEFGSGYSKIHDLLRASWGINTKFLIIRRYFSDFFLIFFFFYLNSQFSLHREFVRC